MEKIVQFSLTDFEAGQVIDGLEVRAQAYERTAAYLDGEEKSGESLGIEEVRDAEEATTIAGVYRKIIESMRKQLKNA